jgi:hypothetical protein
VVSRAEVGRAARLDCPRRYARQHADQTAVTEEAASVGGLFHSGTSSVAHWHISDLTGPIDKCPFLRAKRTSRLCTPTVGGRSGLPDYALQLSDIALAIGGLSFREPRTKADLRLRSTPEQRPFSQTNDPIVREPVRSEALLQT